MKGAIYLYLTVFRQTLVCWSGDSAKSLDRLKSPFNARIRYGFVCNKYVTWRAFSNGL